MKLVTKASAAVTIAVVAVLASASGASANTAPNVYTPTGPAWVDVPTAQRVYFESFNQDYDDSEMFSIPAGVTCTENSISATGPFITGSFLDDTDCVDATATPYDPIDDATRLGALDLGFGINFFGTTYTSLWPSTNGGLFFENPDTSYDDSTAYLAAESGASIFPLGTDLYYDSTESNFWTAQTTVDGKPAVVFSWEKFHNCCSSGASADDMTFQLVLIDQGAGNFNAEFNYSSFANFTEGYSGPTFLFDLATGVTPGSNLVTVDDLTNAAVGCTEGYVSWGSAYGNATDSTLDAEVSNANIFYNVVDTTAKTVSLWSDAACTVPINSNVVQDIAADGYAYVEVTEDADPVAGVGAGWGTIDSATNQLSTYSLVRNIDSASLENGQPEALNVRTLNSTVPGRFIIGQRAGLTVTDPVLLGLVAAPAGPTLAATGVDVNVGALSGIVAALLLAGAASLLYVRKRRIA